MLSMDELKELITCLFCNYLYFKTHEQHDLIHLKACTDGDSIVITEVYSGKIKIFTRVIYYKEISYAPVAALSENLMEKNKTTVRTILLQEKERQKKKIKLTEKI